MVRASKMTPEEEARFRRAWSLFLTKDPRWPSERDAWLSYGGAAPYVLSENLFRYFWSASRLGKRAEVTRVAYEAAHVGEPAVAYFAEPLVTARWPLKEPLTVDVFNPDNPNKPLHKTFTYFEIDDIARQQAAQVLAAIGAPAVPTLASRAVLSSAVPGARTYAAYALGAIATDDAVAALGRMVREGATWQDRGAAAKGLGFAIHKNEAARAPLEAARQDPDPFVRRKAEEALEGKTKIEF